MLTNAQLLLIVCNRWNAMKDKASIVSINLSNQRIGMLERASTSIERDVGFVIYRAHRYAPNIKQDLIKRGKQYL